MTNEEIKLMKIKDYLIPFVLLLFLSILVVLILMNHYNNAWDPMSFWTGVGIGVISICVMNIYHINIRHRVKYENIKLLEKMAKKMETKEKS